MRDMKISFKKIGIYTVGLIAFFGLFSFTKADDRLFDIAKNLEMFTSIFKEINALYVDPVDPNKLIRTGIDDMLESLDPYTNYIAEDEIEDFRTMTTGQYGGVGAMISKHDLGVQILMPYPGSPAMEAGIKIGDIITQIDGKIIKGKEVADISKLLKGQAGTPVKLLLLRNYNTVEVNLVRKQIQIESVPYYGMINNEIGYLHLSEFTANAGKDVKNALVALKEKGAKKIIFDLRGNPGGLLDQAVYIANLFIPKGKLVVSTKGKLEDWNKEYKSEHAAFDLEIPLVVLTSDHSASASEIVAGVIQDYDRGVIVGQKSYGKGLVQSTRPLPYNAQLKLTVAKYYTPSGRCIQAIDYSHRSEDGTVSKMADSLKTAFKTKNGRTVYDGGGITPDVLVEKPEMPKILISLLEKNLLFDYAGNYENTHKTIAEANKFVLTDAEYDEFVKWVANKEYDYKTKVETELQTLIETSKKEKYFEGIKEQISQLENKMSHNKEKDLYTFKKEIRNQLEEQIVARYYFQKGISEASFDHDPDIEQAIKVLNEPANYTKILQGK